MSKAFVREDAGDEDDDEPNSAALTVPAGFRNYITPEGYSALHTEMRRLLDVDRPETVSIVSWAASNGDRSENGDYIYGKKRLREIDRRIRFLTKHIESAVVVDPAAQPNRDQVFFGACVRFSREDQGEQTIWIVGVDEVDAHAGRISWIAPVARALLKAREGDVVTLKTPAGTQALEILEVSYPAPV